MRINQFLAHYTGVSRRKADALVTSGSVKVNGKRAELGQSIDSTDLVTLDDRPIVVTDYLYVVFHKPVGYVTSRGQQGDAPIIYELLPKHYHSLKPVGRLDKDTSGLLLLTNDGSLAESLSHPRNEKQKVYEVRLHKALSADDLKTISKKGVVLHDGLSRMQIKPLNEKNNAYEVILHEGRNRQIRRTFAHLGYEILSLHRTQFGPLQLGGLKPSKTLELDSPPLMQ